MKRLKAKKKFSIDNVAKTEKEKDHRALAMTLPKEQVDGLRQAMHRQPETAGQTQITGKFVIQFAKTLPLPEEYKKQALVLLQGTNRTCFYRRIVLFL